MKIRAFKILFCLFPILGILLMSCEKKISGLGNYAIAIDNNNNKDVVVELFMDNVSKGSYTIIGGQKASYLNNCDQIHTQSGLMNVLLIKNIPEGDHKIVLKTIEATVLSEVSIMIQNDACITQSMCINK